MFDEGGPEEEEEVETDRGGENIAYAETVFPGECYERST